MSARSRPRALPEKKAVLVALLCVSILFVLGAIGSLFSPDPTRFALFRHCLTVQKHLSLGEVSERDAIARSGTDSIQTVIEGNPVTIVKASGTSDAIRIERDYEAVGAGSPLGRLERRDPLIYLWGGPASPTQRQTVYDCAGRARPCCSLVARGLVGPRGYALPP